MKDMIFVICNNGYASDVMEIAKSQGAGGGTIIKGRGSAGKDIQHFLGITIQPEKDIVMIVVSTEIRNNIMKEISSKMGVGTKSHAICFSVPVDATVGIKDNQNNNK